MKSIRRLATDVVGCIKWEFKTIINWNKFSPVEGLIIYVLDSKQTQLLCWGTRVQECGEDTVSKLIQYQESFEYQCETPHYRH